MPKNRKNKVPRARIRLGPVSGDESIDLIARKVLMSAFLYYGLNTPLVSDEQYDAWSNELADRWDELDRYRKWQLGSAEEIRASGYHVKITHATIGGAWSWMTTNGTPITRQVTYIQPWNRSKRYMVEWLHPEHFRYGKPMNELKTKGRKKSCPKKPKKKRVRLRNRVRLT